jgi:hypothetical protein
MTITFRPAATGDLKLMLPDLRTADSEEWRNASGKTPAEHVTDGTWEVPEQEPGRITRAACDSAGPVLL